MPLASLTSDAIIWLGVCVLWMNGSHIRASPHHSLFILMGCVRLPQTRGRRAARTNPCHQAPAMGLWGAVALLFYGDVAIGTQAYQFLSYLIHVIVNYVTRNVILLRCKFLIANLHFLVIICKLAPKRDYFEDLVCKRQIPTWWGASLQLITKEYKFAINEVEGNNAGLPLTFGMKRKGKIGTHCLIEILRRSRKNTTKEMKNGQ